MTDFPQDAYETAVLFRIDNSGSDRQVTAVFPATPADTNGQFMSCYAHLGQHGSCSAEWVRTKTRPATPAEYADLKRELERAPYGYRLKIYARTTPDHRAAFRAEVRRMARPQASFA